MAVQKTQEALRGNERIQQLMEEFPEIHRTLVVKTDLIREGIRPSLASRLAGKWALPDAPWYFEYSKEDTYTAEEAREGYVLRPLFGHFSNGVINQFMWGATSPYEMRYEERGRYRLYRDGEPIEEIFFTSRPQWYDRKTSRGKPMSSVIQLRGEGKLMVVPVIYCEYGKENLQCRYCNINAAEATKKDLGLERMRGKREEDVYETCVAALQEERGTKLNALTISGGVILDSSKEADNYARMIKVLRRAMKDVGQEVHIGAVCQAMAPEDQMKLKEAGASDVHHNLEVWDSKLWEFICPGKAKHVGREKWVEAILRTKEIFGRASTVIICGLEMAPPHGFKTEDEAAESVIEGWEWFMSRGIRASALCWRPAPGTMFEGLPSPRTEYFLRMDLVNYKLAQKYHLVVPEPGKQPGWNANDMVGDLPLVPPRQENPPQDWGWSGRVSSVKHGVS